MGHSERGAPLATGPTAAGATHQTAHKLGGMEGDGGGPGGVDAPSPVPAAAFALVALGSFPERVEWDTNVLDMDEERILHGLMFHSRYAVYFARVNNFVASRVYVVTASPAVGAGGATGVEKEEQLTGTTPVRAVRNLKITDVCGELYVGIHIVPPPAAVPEEAFAEVTVGSRPPRAWSANVMGMNEANIILGLLAHPLFDVHFAGVPAKALGACRVFVATKGGAEGGSASGEEWLTRYTPVRTVRNLKFTRVAAATYVHIRIALPATSAGTGGGGGGATAARIARITRLVGAYLFCGWVAVPVAGSRGAAAHWLNQPRSATHVQRCS